MGVISTSFDKTANKDLMKGKKKTTKKKKKVSTARKLQVRRQAESALGIKRGRSAWRKKPKKVVKKK